MDITKKKKRQLRKRNNLHRQMKEHYNMFSKLETSSEPRILRIY